jgi:hypothetical protein
MQFLALLTTAALAAAAALPNDLAPRGNPASEGGGFVPHCCMFSFLQYHCFDGGHPQDQGSLTKRPANNCATDTYEVGERGELVGRLIGQCGDDELFRNLHDMWLDLNLCLGNYNGSLTWQDK